MFTSLRFFLTPPIFEDENRTRVAGLLNVILILCMGLAASYFVTRFFLTSDNLTGLWPSVVTLIFLIFAWVSLRRGHVRFSSLKVTIGLWLIVTLTIALYDTKGIYDPAFMIYNALIVIAGLTLGGRAALAMTLFTALMSLGIAALTTPDNREVVANLSSPAHWWITANLSFVTTAILIATSHRGLLKALDRARNSERTLREYTRQLVTKTDSLALMNSVADVLHSSLDFNVVIECALDLVVLHTGAASAMLGFLDPESGQVLLVAGRNIPEMAMKYKKPQDVNEVNLTRLALKQKQLISSEDLATDERISVSDRQALTAAGYKSGIVIPLLLHEEILGTIGLMFNDVYKLSPEERALLVSVGRTIALAVANAQHVTRIEAEIEERRKAERQLLAAQEKLVAKTDSLTMINSVADVLHSSLDFQVVIDRALDVVVMYTQAPSGLLYFLDPPTQHLWLAAERNIPPIAIKYKKPHVGDQGGLTYLAVTQKQIVSSADLATDERLGLSNRQAFIEGGFKSAVVIPLMLHEEVFGTIGLIFKEVYTLTAEEQALLVSVGRTIALAIANAQYVSRIEAEIEERRKTEIALRAAEAKYRSIYENAVEGIAQTTPDGRYLNANPALARMLGYDSPEELITTITSIGDQIFVDPEQRHRLAEILEREGQAYFECQNYRKDGSIITIAQNSRVVRDEQGKVLHYEGIVEDITERKRMQAREMELAVALERERVDVLKQFLHCATHDLRTPLTIMHTSLDLLRRTAGSPERQTRYIDQITEQTQRMHQMIENMFILSELDAGTAQYYFEPYSINSVVNEACKKARPLAERKQHQITLALTPDLPDLRIDNVALTTALRHVLVNALNYTPEGGKIGLRTYQRDQAVVIEVTDNGIGISPEDLPRVFERFYRADEARQADTGTSGLGLTIAQKFVEAHRGSIQVESQPGLGSTFRLVLPYFLSDTAV